jgi:hypothetical protein
MHPILRAALTAAVVAGGASGALAQSASVDRNEPFYYEDLDTRSNPRVYRYRTDEPPVVIPLRPANCGVYHYWDGKRCVDARDVPPALR